MVKYRENLSANRRPLIITTGTGVVVTEELAKGMGISERVEAIDFVQFIVANIHERSLFNRAERQVRLEQLIENAIIDAFETDHSLKSEVAPGR